MRYVYICNPSDVELTVPDRMSCLDESGHSSSLNPRKETWCGTDY
jgi:hypothetical protein